MSSSILILATNISISIEFLIIVILFLYITYLHLQLSKKNFLIKSYLNKSKKNNKINERQDILGFLENLKNPDYKGTVTKDKMLDRQFSKFLFENDQEIKLFLHYTAQEDIAEKIIREGFKFANSFYKTAEYIYNDELFLIHRHHEHKQYGQYVIVICISNNLYNHYSKELSKRKAKNIAVEQILTEKPSYIDDNSDEIFILPEQYIKGYFNYLDGSIVKNPEFDFNYRSPLFEENLNNLQRF